MAEKEPSPDSTTPSVLATDQVSQPEPSPTPLPESNEGPLIPPFTPSYACELQNDTTSVSNGEQCRSERIQEEIAAEGDNVVFIHRTYHRGYGCWSAINSYSYQLKSCNLTSGESVILLDKQTTPLMPSPDGLWFAFGAIDIEQLEPHVYRVGRDGSGLQKLDTRDLPGWAVSVAQVAWSSSGEWLTMKLWDGTTDGWHPYRIATDGSGLYEVLAPPDMTLSPTAVIQLPDDGNTTPPVQAKSDITPEPSGSDQLSTPGPLPSPTTTSGDMMCPDTWFFSFPFDYQGHCPRPVVVSQAAVQPFEHGLMIWLAQPGRYFVLTNQILYEGEQRKINYVLDDPLSIASDTSANYLPPEGLFAPQHGFGLVWRGDVDQSSGFQDSLGWATAPESGYEAVYQCESPTVSGGHSWQFCYLRAANGDVIAFHPLDGWMWLNELEP